MICKEYFCLYMEKKSSDSKNKSKNKNEKDGVDRFTMIKDYSVPDSSKNYLCHITVFT